MAGKRFFWLKLQEDFFQQKAMKKLRRMERGEILTIIYLKMQLASLRNGGVIAFEGFGDSFAEELSLQLDEREEDVSSTVEFLVKCGLMEQIDSTDSYILPEAIRSTGSEGDSAARVRAFRERKALQCNDDSLQIEEALHCNDRERVEKKREDSEREGDSAATPPARSRDGNNLIFLSDTDYDQLRDDLGESELSRVILYLSDYCRLHKKTYPDWPFVIRKASRERWGIKPSNSTSTPESLQPTADRIRKNNDWLDSFLAKQAEAKSGGGADGA